MRFKTVEIETKEGVAHVWLNRPQVHNAFDEKLIADLTHALGELETDAQVRVVVLGGRGKSFCAGADLAWMKKAAAYTVDENLRDAQALTGMLKALDRLSKPTIARVQGAALGGGLGLVAACDIAVAASTTVFGTTEVRFGLIPATIGPYVMAAIGRRAARRFFLSGERISADAARPLGLVHEVCELQFLDDRVETIVQALLLGGPRAQAEAKRLTRVMPEAPIEDWTLERTARWIAELRASPEAKEGIAAFLEKRPPAWNSPRGGKT